MRSLICLVAFGCLVQAAAKKPLDLSAEFTRAAQRAAGAELAVLVDGI